jgi:hypothetical protein
MPHPSRLGTGGATREELRGGSKDEEDPSAAVPSRLRASGMTGGAGASNQENSKSRQDAGATREIETDSSGRNHPLCRKAPEARQKLAQSREGWVSSKKNLGSAVGATPTRRQILDRIPRCASSIGRGIPFRRSFSCDAIPDFGCIGRPLECWKRLR